MQLWDKGTGELLQRSSAEGGHVREGLSRWPRFSWKSSHEIDAEESRNGDEVIARVRLVFASLSVQLPGFCGGTWGVCDRMSGEFL